MLNALLQGSSLAYAITKDSDNNAISCKVMKLCYSYSYSYSYEF